MNRQKDYLILLLILNAPVFAQPGQLDIPRVTQMPNIPSPYIMRDWKDVTLKYDEFVYSTSATGQYLPLIELKSTGINYPELSPILLQTYVGTASSNQAEAINIIPSLVGASLAGVDKSDQDGIDWILKCKEFFNQANGQNVYLNGYSSTSGSDWWYDVMPNVFFYQLYTQYPFTAGFDQQFTTVADRWLAAVYAMGGSTTPWAVPQMNYRAWNLATMTGNADGVKEPEASGAIGWLLYHAYLETGEPKYLDGAQMAMDFLSGLSSNPAYELQLPLGAFLAAKMNAELGTAYNVPKIVNWCFDRGPLRGWGVIAGTWNGSDVSGLIGEANDEGNDYAFIMNGFQQASALVPMVKYDKRFARSIAKWTLNLANASRLFYAQYLPQTSQDDYAWSAQYDPESVIAYEGLKEKNNFDDNKPLYGTGDAKQNGWAQTNLGLYGSSHVGYLGAIAESTDVDGILKLDMNKTDFFGENTFPSFLFYNPFNVTAQVTLSLGAQSYDIYDAISEMVIKSNATGDTSIDIPGDESLILIYIPAGSTPEEKDGKLYLEDDVIDYHFGYNFEGKLRIKSLDTKDKTVEYNQEVPLFSEIENATGTVTYDWYVNDLLTSSSTADAFTWTAPEAEGVYKMLLEVTSGVSAAKDSVYLTVVERIPVPPVIDELETDKSWYPVGGEASATCTASNSHGGPLAYTWTLPDGSAINQSDPVVHFNVPQTEGLYVISCEVTNDDDLSITGQKQILVKGISSDTLPYAYYPLDGNVLDYSGNGRDAILIQAELTSDSRGEPDKAYKFSSGSDLILLEHEPGLNFQDKITLSFWVKLDALTHEAFILSHGSWEERWKVSVTPESRLRWTVKTSIGTKDIDSSFLLELNRFYHFAVAYTGYSVELYADGELDVFSGHTGLIATTTKSLTFGEKEEGVTDYFLSGTLDEVRIYNSSLAPEEIGALRMTWNTVTAIEDNSQYIHVYPNPVQNDFYITGLKDALTSLDIFDASGRAVPFTKTSTADYVEVRIDDTSHGFMFLKLQTAGGVYHKKLIRN